jgi:CDP-diacylglycerol--serine O-phosphatidyltransferase
MSPAIRRRRPNMRRAVILFPSGLTLGNLFFGVFAIIAASRNQFVQAGVYVMLGGICDALDGRVARATNAGSQFGEELDSLVDAITFGLAPALIMYFAVLNRENWDWIVVFFFAACAVMRLARFNIEQAGTAKTYFQGLPSPAAGITLASYYWFSQSWLYNYGAIADLPWHVLLRFLMLALAFLMISNVPYPTFPRTGFRSFRALGASLIVFGAIALLLTKKLEYFFPLALIYIAWGLVRWVFSGLFERRQPTIPYDLSEGEDEEEEEEFQIGDSQVHASRQGHRELQVARSERQKSRPERPERTDRPPRTEERVARTEEPTDRVARVDRAEKPERPERTPEERAARREKREKREKREGRPERGPRPERTVAPIASASGVDAITLGEPAAEPVTDDEVIGRIPGGAEPDAAATADGSPARKRKRRRRRSDRKDRAGADSTAGGDSAGSDEGGESGFDDEPTEAPSRPFTPPAPASAPTSTPAPEPRAYEPPTYTPPAAPQPAAPPTPPSSEPSE